MSIYLCNYQIEEKSIKIYGIFWHKLGNITIYVKPFFVQHLCFSAAVLVESTNSGSVLGFFPQQHCVKISTSVV